MRFAGGVVRFSFDVVAVIVRVNEVVVVIVDVVVAGNIIGFVQSVVEVIDAGVLRSILLLVLFLCTRSKRVRM